MRNYYRISSTEVGARSLTEIRMIACGMLDSCDTVQISKNGRPFGEVKRHLITRPIGRGHVEAMRYIFKVNDGDSYVLLSNGDVQRPLSDREMKMYF